jgi:hypothetical protein
VADGFDISCDSMAGHKRKPGYLPTVIEHAQITVPNPAVAGVCINYKCFLIRRALARI